MFLRAPYRGGKDRPGRPGSRVKEIEFERERYPSFQKRDAHALRFGSMNPITRLWVHGVFVASLQCGFGAGFRVFAASLLWGFGGELSDFEASLLWGNTAVAEITIGGWAKVIIWGGSIIGFGALPNY